MGRVGAHGAVAVAVGIGIAFGGSGCASPTSQADAAPSRFVEAPTVSSAAVRAYGPRAEQAYREIANFVLDSSASDALLDPRRTHVEARELTDGITGHLTPAAASAWNRYAARAAAGDQASEEVVHTLRLFALDAPGLSLPPRGSAIQNQTISGAKVDVVPAAGSTKTPRLRISFEHDTRLKLMNGKSPAPATVAQPLTFTVVPADTVTGASAAPTASPSVTPPSAVDPSARWLIQHFEGETEIEVDGSDRPAPKETGRA